LRFEFVEHLDSLTKTPEDAAKLAAPSVLLITKTAKYLRGHITDHNVRINSDGRLRGRVVFLVDKEIKNIDANDISSLEALKV
jgi:hypothetical protein